MWVPPERFVRLQRQPFRATAAGGSPNRQPHPNARRGRDNRRSRTSSTSRSAEALTPRAIAARQFELDQFTRTRWRGLDRLIRHYRHRHQSQPGRLG
jgi:hypothetical protein